MVTTKTANPFADINIRYVRGRVKAKHYIMENLYWSEPTFYRKMRQLDKLSDAENEVIATAYRLFIHEPLKAVFETAIA
jgi:hypothetical protein